MKFTKSIVATVVAIVFSVPAFAQGSETNELNGLLTSNPVSQEELASFVREVAGNDHSISPDDSSASFSESNVESAHSEESAVVKTLDVKDQTPVPSQTNDGLYLVNIPTSSFLKMNKEVLLVPNDVVAFFEDGERVYENPFKKDKYGTFCMLRFSESANARRMKVKSTYSVGRIDSLIFDKKMGLDKDKHIQLVKIPVANNDFKQVICYSGSMNSPMTISDMNRVTGGIFSVNLQMYRDI